MKPRSSLRRTLGRGVLPEQASFLLTSRLRAFLQYPRRTLVQRLGGITVDSRVLELGCGPGYFTPALAERRAAGRLIVVDLQHGMLRRARRRVACCS